MTDLIGSVTLLSPLLMNFIFSWPHGCHCCIDNSVSYSLLIWHFLIFCLSCNFHDQVDTKISGVVHAMTWCAIVITVFFLQESPLQVPWCASSVTSNGEMETWSYCWNCWQTEKIVTNKIFNKQVNYWNFDQQAEKETDKQTEKQWDSSVASNREMETWSYCWNCWQTDKHTAGTIDKRTE